MSRQRKKHHELVAAEKLAKRNIWRLVKKRRPRWRQRLKAMDMERTGYGLIAWTNAVWQNPWF